MRQWSIIGFFLFAILMVFIGNARTETLPLPTVEFPQALHFLTPGGEDVVVEQGMYEVTQASEWIEFIPMGRKKTDAILVEATSIDHEETIKVPTTRTLSEHEDEYVLMLLLPNGNGLEAIGSYSGVRSKAVRRSNLRRAPVKRQPKTLKQSAKKATPPNLRRAPAKRPRRNTTKPIKKGVAPNLTAVRAYDVIDGQPSYQVSYRRDPALQVQLSGPRPTHIRIGNNSRFKGAIWQTYQRKKTYRYSFPLNAGLGQKTIFVQAQVQSSPRMAPLLSRVRTARIQLRQGPEIQNLTIAGSQGASPGVTYGRNVTVTWTRMGQANIARIGQQAQLTDLHAMGNTFTSGPTTSMSFQLSPGYGQKTIYVQLIDKPFANNPSVYARSAVVSATIDLQPVTARTITFESVQDVSGVIDVAMAQGYTFEAWKSGGYEGECRLEKVDGVYNMVADLIYEAEYTGTAYGPGPSSLDVRSIGAVRPIVCNFKLFAGKALKSSWKLKLVGIVSHPNHTSNMHSSWFFNPPLACQGPKWQKTPSGSSSDPEIRLGIHSTRVDVPDNDIHLTCLNHYYHFGPTLIYYLRGLTLEGPVNQEWQQAFQP